MKFWSFLRAGILESNPKNGFPWCFVVFILTFILFWYFCKELLWDYPVNKLKVKWFIAWQLCCTIYACLWWEIMRTQTNVAFIHYEATTKGYWFFKSLQAVIRKVGKGTLWWKTHFQGTTLSRAHYYQGWFTNCPRTPAISWFVLI